MHRQFTTTLKPYFPFIFESFASGCKSFFVVLQEIIYSCTSLFYPILITVHCQLDEGAFLGIDHNLLRYK
jgi:hypothetical protein